MAPPAKHASSSRERHIHVLDHSDLREVRVKRMRQRLSDAFPATNEVKNEHHEGDDEQDMNESTGDMKSKSTAPKEQKKNGDN